MIKNKSLILESFRLDFFLFGISLAIFCFLRFDFDYSFSLDSINNLILSQATADGVDIGLRVKTFYKSLFLGGIISLIGIFSLSKLFNILKIEVSRYRELLLFYLAYISSAFLFSMGINTQLTIDILEGIILLRLVSILINEKQWIKVKIDFAYQLSCSFIILLLVNFSFGEIEWVTKNLNLLIISVFSIITILNILTSQFLKTTDIKTLLGPVFFIPWLLFLSIELNFLTQNLRGEFLGYKKIFFFSFIILTSFFFLFKNKTYQFFFKKGLFINSSLIFAYVILAYYNPFINYNNELFELANPANSIINVFKFDEIPFLDFSSSHMLSEQWFGYLYNFIFGYNGSLNFLTYQFFNKLIFLLVTFVFFKKLFKNNYLSLFFCFFLPFLEDILFSSIFLAVIPLFLIENLIREKNSKSFITLFLSIFLLIIWRIDTGAAALLSTTLILPISFFCSKERFPTLVFLKSGLIFLTSILLILFLSFLFRSPSQIFENILLSWHYFTGNQAHGYSSILTNNTHQFYIYHVLFPSISVFISIWIIFKLKLKNAFSDYQDNFSLISSLYLFILFISNAQRGLVRHGFAENSEKFFVSTFYLALAIFISSLIKTTSPKVKASFVFGFSFLLFVSFKFFSLLPNETKLENGLKNSSFANLDQKFNDFSGSRVLIDDEFNQLHINDFKKFLDKNLDSSQTFLDFSNTPMLYFFTERKIPGYFNQNLQNTIDDFMQMSLIEDVSLKDVPVVIFSNDPPGWFDMTDGIRNTVRYYIVAEFILKNYIPYKTINHKSIWVTKDIEKKLSKDNYNFYPYEEIDLKLLPYYTHKFFFENKEHQFLKEIFSFDFSQITNNELVIPKEILAQNHLYIAFEFNDSENIEEQYQFEFLSKLKKLSVYFKQIKSENQTYYIRASNHPIWHSSSSLKVNLIKMPLLKKVVILKDKRFFSN